MTNNQPQPTTHSLKWWVCGLLLLATTLNYMDRLTLNQMAVRLMAELEFGRDGYGDLEAYFGIAFAVGSLTAGWLVDRLGVYLVYPVMVTLWSMAGFLTGFARDYHELLACRVLLGLFEAANWPCALKTTQQILSAPERAMGNGMLQSGTAIGAVLTPLVVQACLDLGMGWRVPFLVIGGMGAGWVLLWFLVVQPRGLHAAQPGVAEPMALGAVLARLVADRRFWVLVTLVICINLTWHFFRAWLPLFLREVHEYSERTVNYFSTAYYLSADAGSLLMGFLALRLASTGLGVHRSRTLVYAGCAVVALLSLPIAQLSRGPVLLGLLLLLGFAALGLFPIYYSFSQELTAHHQGKVSGLLGFLNWVAMFFMQRTVGRYIEGTGDYSLAVALAGIPPMIGLGVLLLLWRGSSR
jgi:ACS family hexuronate transporter-like MFS transporter